MRSGAGGESRTIGRPVAVPHHRGDPTTRAIVWAIAALAGMGAVLAPGEPTGLAVIDAAWRAGLAVVVTLATARSRRWPCVWQAGIAAAVSSGVGLVAAIAAFVLASLGVFSALRNRILGAASGAFAAQALLRLPEIGFHGLPSLIVLLAIGPVLWSAYRCAHRSTRKLVRQVGLGAALLLVVIAAGAGIAMLLAYPNLNRAIDQTREGRRLLDQTELTAAADTFDQASDSFASAERSLNAPWALPARLVPVLSQHTQVVSHSSGSGKDLSLSASTAAISAPYQELRPSAGQIDLATTEKMRGPVTASVDDLRAARDQLADDRSPWLVEPLDRQLTLFADELDDSLPEAELAAQALEVAPSLLGSDGPRRYLVLFTSPAETRFLGGFAGAYGILTAQNGKVTFDESGNIGDLNDRSDAETRVLPDFAGRAEYDARYGRFFPARFLQNLTVSPDFPTDAFVTRDLYRQVTGETLDGVIVADPYALAGFLELTGPVDVEGLDFRINADNALDYLLVDQYVKYADDNEERRERLGDVADATFDALTSRELPGPARVGKVLGPAVHEKHLMVWTFDEQDQLLFDRIGASGRFTPSTESDFFSLRTSNGGPNKIDTFLERSVIYDVTYDARNGTTSATATIRLINRSPTLLPDYVIGNAGGEPPGTNVMYLSFYSPLDLRSAKVDGAPRATSALSEFGINVYSLPLAIPPATTMTVTLDLAGELRSGAMYELTASSQPLVAPDQVAITVRAAPDGWPIHSSDDLEVGELGATWTGTLARDESWYVRFAPTP
jgi:hypothetical protein